MSGPYYGAPLPYLPPCEGSDRVVARGTTACPECGRVVIVRPLETFVDRARLAFHLVPEVRP